MGFRCGITGQHSGSGVKPVVIRYYIEREYDWGSHISKGREVVKEVLALPTVAPKEREVTMPGVRQRPGTDLGGRPPRRTFRDQDSPR